MLRKADDDNVPFTSGQWTLGRGGKSVSFSGDGVIRHSKHEDAKVNMRAVQAMPALYHVAMDYRDLIENPGDHDPDDINKMKELIDGIEHWIRTGDDAKWAAVVEGDG